MKSCIPQEKGNCCEQVQVWGCQRDLHNGRFSFGIYRDKEFAQHFSEFVQTQHPFTQALLTTAVYHTSNH